MNGPTKHGEFLPGIVLPQEVHGLLRMRLTEISVCDTVDNCLIIQARADSLVEEVALSKALPDEAIQRLYSLIRDVTERRIDELGRH